MLSLGSVNSNAVISLISEWLPQLATASSIGTIHECLASVFGALRNDETYHLIWRGPPELPLATTLEIVPTVADQQLLAAGQVVSHTSNGQPWTLLPLLHGALRGWLALPNAHPNDAGLLPVALQTAAILTALSDDTQLLARIRELTLLDEIGQTLNGSLELTPLLEAIHHAMERLIGPQNLFIALYDSNSGLFRFAAHFVNGTNIASMMQWTVAHGLTGVVLRRNQALSTDKYLQTCAQYGVAPLLFDTIVPQLWAGVPMRHGDRMLGVLAIYSNDPTMRYSNETIRCMEMVARRAAGNFEQTRLYERTTQQARQLTLLNELGRTLTSTLDLEAVPSLIMGRVQQIMDVEEGSLLLLDEATNELVFSYSLTPYGQQLLGRRLPPSVGIAGLVMRTGQSLIANAAHDHPAFYPDIDEITGHLTRDLLCVPLLGPRGVLGVIEIINHRTDAPFTPDDRALLEAVADQAVIAIENAYLYTRTDRALSRRISELDERNKQLQEILQIGNALKAASDLRSVLPQLAEAVRTSTRFKQVVISLVEHQPSRRSVLRRVAAAGIDESAFVIQQTITADPEKLETLLQPMYQRGAATFYINYGTNGDGRLWGDTVIYPDVPEPRLGGWHPNDMLFTVLRSAIGELLGLLSVSAPMDGMLPTSEQIQTLEIFANQLVVALENNRLYDQLRQSLQGLTALSGLGMAINSAFHDAQAIWQFTVGGIMDSTGALGAGVLMAEEATEPLRLYPVLALGTPHLPDDALLRLAIEVVTNGKPLGLIAERYKLPPVIAAVGGGALLMLPLFGTHATLGALYVWYPDVLPLPEEQDLIALFAGQAAVAVENMRLAAAVREGRDRLASILASTEEAILLLTPELTVVEANATLVRLIGLGDPQSLLGQPIAELLGRSQDIWNTPVEAWADLNNALVHVSSGQAAEARGQLELSGGRSHWLEWTALPVRSEAAQSPHPLILVLRDITTMIEAENLRQDLTYMMIHDLRGPLSSVMTSLDMLTKQMMGDINEGQEKVLRIALRSSRRLLDMVNLLMDISKLEAGQMPVVPAPVALADIFRNVIQSYEPLLAERKVSVAVSASADLPFAYIDIETIERVIQNLVDNAIKYTPTGSTIALTARHATAADLPVDHPAGAWLLVIVRDAGPGIQPQHRERVFQKFAQIQKASVKGTGLGLTYSRLAVETHGGRIWVGGDGEPGAVFALTLPIVAHD